MAGEMGQVVSQAGYCMGCIAAVATKLPMHPPARKQLAAPLPCLPQGRALDSVRLPLYSALASYLTMCRWGQGQGALGSAAAFAGSVLHMGCSCLRFRLHTRRRERERLPSLSRVHQCVERCPPPHLNLQGPCAAAHTAAGGGGTTERHAGGCCGRLAAGCAAGGCWSGREGNQTGRFGATSGFATSQLTIGLLGAAPLCVANQVGPGPCACTQPPQLSVNGRCSHATPAPSAEPARGGQCCAAGRGGPCTGAPRRRCAVCTAGTGALDGLLVLLADECR